MNQVNSIPNKLDIAKVFEEFQEPLMFLGLVHVRGLEKYTCHGWLKDAKVTDAEPMRNINAAYRHLAAHTMGAPIDIEGLPHLCHMCCRLAMTYNYLALVDNNAKIRVKEDEYSKTVFGQIWPPVVIALGKCLRGLKHETRNDTLTGTMALFNVLLVTKNLEIKPFEEEITLLEKTIFNSFLFVKHEFKRLDIDDYLLALRNKGDLTPLAATPDPTRKI